MGLFVFTRDANGSKERPVMSLLKWQRRRSARRSVRSGSVLVATAVGSLVGGSMAEAGAVSRPEVDWTAPRTVARAPWIIGPTLAVEGAYGVLTYERETDGHESTGLMVRTWDGRDWVDAQLIGEDHGDPGLAVNNKGDAIIAWSDAGWSSVDSIHVTSGTAGEPWTGVPEQIDTAPEGQYFSPPEAAVNSAGAAAVWWTEGTPAHSGPRRESLRISYRPREGTWGDAEVPSGTHRRLTGDAVLDRLGRLTVVYATQDGIYVRVRSVRGHWRPVRQIAHLRSAPWEGPRIESSPNGTVKAVAWQRNYDAAVVAVRQQSGEWGARTRLTSRRLDSEQWDYAVSGAGSVMTAWITRSDAVGTTRWRPGHAVGQVRQIIGSPPHDRLFRSDIEIETDNARGVVASWLRHRLYRTTPDRLQAAYRRLPGPWSKVEALNAGETGEVFTFGLGIGDAVAHAAWLNVVPEQPLRVRYSRLR